MVALVRVRGARCGKPTFLLEPAGPGGDVRIPALDQRHPVHRGSGASNPRRGLSPLSGGNPAALSQASKGEGPLSTVDLLSLGTSASLSPGVLGLAERGLVPDALVRHGIRRLCAARLAEERAGGIEAQSARFEERLAVLTGSPVAIQTEAANAQHYELPPAFFEACLGRRLKYSCAYYPRGNETLDQAEEAMLELYGVRAELEDGQRILELGCGWGSLTVWMAERFPRAHIEAVSNSRSQREFIEA